MKNRVRAKSGKYYGAETPKKKKRAKPKGNGEKKEVGRPSDFQEVFVQQVYSLCLLGAKDTEIAGYFGVDERTLNVWKKKHPEFHQSMKEGKIGADASVAATLFEVATDPKHFQSVQAMGLWLRNRRPDLWNASNKQEVTGKDGAALIPQIVVMTEVDKKRLENI